MSRIIDYTEATSPVSDDYLVIDSSTAGTRKIKPENLISDVKEDLTYEVGELYEEYPLTWNEGGYVAPNGSITSITNQSYTDFFTLKNSEGILPKVIKITKPNTNDWAQGCFYNQAEQKVGDFFQLRDVLSLEIAVPNGAIKCRISTHKDVYTQTKVVCKEHAIKDRVDTLEETTGVLIDDYNLVWNEGGYVNNTGGITAITNQSYTDIFTLAIDGLMPTTLDIKKPTADWINYCFYDENGEFVSFAQVEENLSAEVVVPSTASKMRMSIHKGVYPLVSIKASVVETIISNLTRLSYLSGEVKMMLQGGNIAFASQLENHDMVLTAEASNSRADANPIFNFLAYTMDGEPFKGAADDIAPIQIHQPNASATYIGGGHGFSNGLKLTTSNTKTEADIGSVWEDANGVEFVIYNVGTGYVKVVNPTVKAITSPLTHKSGATDTTQIVFSASEMAFILPATNGHLLKYLDADGTELTDDGKYTSKFFDVVESYNIIDPVAVIDYLKDNVGDCTNDSVADSSIQNLCKVNIVYRITKGCACTVYQSVDSIEDVVYMYAGLVQCGRIGSYAYVPDAFNNDIQQIGNSQIGITKTAWNDSNKVPYRYYEFSNANYETGFFLGYYPRVGVAENSKRIAKCNNAGIFNTTKKIYPYLINGVTINSGETVEAICFRNPLIKRSDGSLAVTFNYVGNDVVVCIDYQSAFYGFVDLIDDCVGKQIEVIDKTSNCTMSREIASSTKLPIIFTGKGYAVLRFY